MYHTLLILHSINRWLVLISLVYAILTAWKGYRSNKAFSRQDNTIRHVTATVSHIQLTIGMLLYMVSPIVKFETGGTGLMSEHTFFSVLHTALMAVSVVIITIGSARAKRMEDNRAKFKTMLIWFSLALLIIMVAIPWPFSPLAHRPYYRF